MQEFLVPLLIAGNILLTAVLLIILLAQKRKSKDDEKEIRSLTEKLSSISFDSRHVADELQRNRADLATNQKIMREEMASSIQKMADELLKMRKDTYDYHLKMNELISNSLGSMRKENSEQTERQNLVIRKSIEEISSSEKY